MKLTAGRGEVVLRRLIRLSVVAASVAAVVQAQTPPPLLARPPEPPTATVSVSREEAWKVALVHPTPTYPPEARRRHITGKGLYHVHVSYETGEVTSVEILMSAGHRILDDSVVTTFKQWKFRPHTVIGLKVPITFSIHPKT